MVLWIVGVMAVWTADPAAGRPQLQADLPVDSSVRAAEALLEQATADDTAGQSDADTLKLVREERRAESELAVGAIRLGLLKARVRLAQHKPTEAIAVAQAALKAAAQTGHGDQKTLVEPLERIIAEARAYKPDLRDPANSVQGDEADGDHGPSGEDGHKRAFDRWRERAYMKIKETVRLTDRSERDEEVRAYQDQALRRQGEDPAIYGKVLIYPADWEAIRKLRADRDDGVIYRSPEFVDSDGETKFTAVYDIGGLTMDRPHFNNAPVLDLQQMLQASADREALRRTSEIFNGTAQDLAAGVPLLHYFGGIDESHPMPAGPEQGYRDLMRIIQEVMEAGKP